MKNRAFSTMLASAIVLGSPMAGCSGAGADHPKLASDNSPALAPKIERALADKNVGDALTLAEQFVGADPQSGDARALLGRAYLANGRYVSARTAFNDALTLGNSDPRTIVSLSLAEAGMGNPGGARQLLADHISDLPAGDYGLAMAMAGDAQEGVRALIEASRLPDATAKTRQNLAYALAMGGAWGQARLVAGQDLTAREAEARIAQWSQSFQQAKGADRVVAMIGVAPRTDDAGLPAQLALNAAPKAAEPLQLASAQDAVPAPVAAQAELAKAAVEPAQPAFAPSALAAAFAKSPPPRVAAPAAFPTTPAAATAVATPAPLAQPAVKTDSTPAPVVAAAFNPAPIASKPAAKPAAPSVQAAFRQPAIVSAAPKARSSWIAAISAPASDAKASDWVVQIGAFDSEAISREKWQRLSKSRSELKPYNVVNSTVAHDGRTFHRLALRGFESRGAAVSACSTLRTSGQACFVRLDDTPSTKQARDKALASAAQPGGRSRPAR